MIDTSKELVVDILTEQFIPDHVFVCVAKGAIRCFDGHKNYTFKAGDYCLARKNRLARYTIEKGIDEFEPIIVCLEERFLKSFQEKHKIETVNFRSSDTFIKINKNKLIPNFIRSLKPYYNKITKIDQAFEDVKNEELLIILLQNQPELAGIFFNYSIPEKIDLEEFMNRNYKFNVSIQRFAYLTGRSLSAFKRDFKAIFNEPPNQWLVKKRLQEAYLLINKKNKKPSEIYLDLGFQDLSHFSFAFKKLFSYTPTELIARKNTSH
ncbi:helix-turn-helix domain-containing protein [Spirosoma sp. HMF4905]|uniref:Helix-turn-helix domain-containing protein n=1 Tax=Spirosoma arboris TaxID=2682092 RepID=A0A7K1S5A7_9BACT|nr:AraC family transcriptional regulator [Spirosoma arboris]MVM29013.1 helix-turn-helix domain-containing protein [Spirosoma arboris]